MDTTKKQENQSSRKIQEDDIAAAIGERNAQETDKEDKKIMKAVI